MPRAMPVVILTLFAVSASAQVLTGRQVFEHTCHTCHARGVAGAPQFGNRKAWRAHLAKGIKVLYRHAIHGYYGYSFMPPKGGDESLTDSEVRAAVRYMVAAAAARP
ncbi:c-type cytochrome [Acidiferrobacter sp.]|uniref:c-type cytochrome n=1 Tax=Acidiferrobacter sp. TaxID=1872107 RepID=UPI00263967E1|nr:c-type cytochrome [Acidiferrobacter sp.]